MIPNDAHDPMLQDLAGLRRLAPDPARAERVRARCRAQLGRARRSDRSATIVAVARRFLAPVIVGCVCVLYVAELVGTALRLHSIFG
jgi:hypothetical protein